MNASGTGTLRSRQDIKKKWQDLQGKAKKKEVGRKREMTKTGGGAGPANPTDLEGKVKLCNLKLDECSFI